MADIQDQIDRLESILDNFDSKLKPWPGDVRRAMNNVGVAQGPDGLPKIHRDKNDKTVLQIHQESYALRFEDLSTRYKLLKSESAGLRHENSELKLELSRLKYGESADGDVFNGEIIDVVPLLERNSNG